MLEGFVITPRVVGDKVGLQPIWVLLALLIAGELFGFLGVLMALPAAAVLKVFIVRGIRYYRSSSAFGGDFAAGPGGHAEPAQEPVDPTQAREPTPPTGGRVDP
jgi:hypothetical protein